MITAPGWVNIDASWNAWLAKHPWVRSVLSALRVVPPSKLDIPWSPDLMIHDVRKPLPFADNFMTAVYASHLLEHLYLDETHRLLGECLRVLQPGGVLRVVVPDLQAIVREYLGEGPFHSSRCGTSGVTSADRMNQRLLLRTPQTPSGNLLYRIYAAIKDFHSHKWMYDATSLASHLRSAGFVEVHEMALHESCIAGIEEVEDPSRVLNGEGFCVEGVKPQDPA
ncbi:MAG: hypothetical protein AUI36_06350 [Cyanobacteria bacterium 13_1_40CM_2_61_4]|nr:MAG: hypothetical protein AUI36_06350 [Cyanobacteria bacterium 13_1_40CM_2_61_4]